MPHFETRIPSCWADDAGVAVYDALTEHRARGGHVHAWNLESIVEEGTKLVRDSLTAAVLMFTADLEEEES